MYYYNSKYCDTLIINWCISINIFLHCIWVVFFILWYHIVKSYVTVWVINITHGGVGFYVKMKCDESSSYLWHAYRKKHLWSNWLKSEQRWARADDSYGPWVRVFYGFYCTLEQYSIDVEIIRKCTYHGRLKTHYSQYANSKPLRMRGTRWYHFIINAIAM